MQLFSDNSSDDQFDDDGVLNVRSEFDGPVGKRLFALQNRIGHDPRFRLDARFHEEDGETESVESAAETSKYDEQQRALDVLGSVIPGLSLSRIKVSDGFRSVNMQRYDPSSADHQNFEIQPKEKKKLARVVKEPPSTASEELLGVDQKIYFECTNNLKDTFVHTVEPFSLFGETTVRTSEEKEEQIEQRPREKKVFGTVETSIKTVTAVPDEESKRLTFFSDCQCDAKVKASLEFFCQHRNVKDIQTQWQQKRYNLIQLYRQRHRDAVRKLKSKNHGLHKKNYKR